MKQRTLTLVKRIDPKRCGEVREQLRVRGDQVQRGDDRRFHDVPGLHFIACCILEGLSEQQPPMLVVELSFDGRKRALLKWVVTHRREQLDEILGGCVDYPPRDAPNRRVIRFLSRGLRPNTVYVGTPGRGLAQIREERCLRGRLAAELERTSECAMSRAERWRRAVAGVYAKSPGLARVPKRPWRVRFGPANTDFWRWYFAGVWRAAALALGVLGVIAALRWPREPWHWLVVAGVPGALGLAAGLLFLAHAPKRLTLRGSWSKLWPALRETVSTSMVVLALIGLAIAGRGLELDWAVLGGAIVSLLGVLLSAALTVGVLVLCFTRWGPIEAWAAALATTGLLVALHRVQSAGAFLGEVLAAVALGALLVVGLAFRFVLSLRRLESEREVWNGDVDLEHLKLVKRREYQQVQSHLASEVCIADGSLPLATLLSVLRWINLLAHYWYNRGHLDRITTIHFARFLVLPERRSMVFLSNYDDRFEDYLGDFAGMAGVTAVWGNARGFPRPFLLVLDGARNESLFKRYARKSQLESLVWYSAYPDLTVAEIDEATTLREQMARPVDDGASGLAAGLARWWRRPLDERSLVGLIDGH